MSAPAHRYEFTLPDVGEGLDKGVVLAWRVAEGDAVKADQIIAEVETDKAIVEIPAPVTGTVIRLGARAGETLAVGEVLAVFETAGAAAPPPAESPAPERATASLGSAPERSDTATAALARPGRARASPATRKLARTRGVDLSALAGTGSRGQITREDVEHAAAGADRAPRISAAPSPPPPVPAAAPGRPAAPRPAAAGDDTTEPLTGLRRQIALNMDLAWRTVPHIFTFEEIDATELVRAREAINRELADEGRRLSVLPFFVKACVAALQAHPRFNASLDLANERIVYHHRCNIGIATATPDGLIVTVVADADTKSLAAIAGEIDTLAALARERRVTVAQIRGSTFTISNYGSYGAWMGTPIVRPPEVAIAGFGQIRDAVVPVDGAPAVRRVLPITVATDHRLNDGEHLGAFLGTLTRYLSEPVRLLAR